MKFSSLYSYDGLLPRTILWILGISQIVYHRRFLYPHGVKVLDTNVSCYAACNPGTVRWHIDSLSTRLGKAMMYIAGLWPLKTFILIFKGGLRQGQRLSYQHCVTYHFTSACMRSGLLRKK
jgi:hypothetical protein